jgi:hypothetical protein
MTTWCGIPVATRRGAGRGGPCLQGFEPVVPGRRPAQCAGSNQKVWWKCAKRHVWEARIKARTIGGERCLTFVHNEQKAPGKAMTARRHRRNRQLAQVARTSPVLDRDGPPF